MTGYSDEQIELMIARLGTDEYNQGVPRCAPWRTSPSCSGPDRWIVYQPTGSDQSRIITEGVRQPFADLIAAARELVPALLARACKAEAERDAQRARADHNANAVNENADMIVRLRAELAEANAENDRLRGHVNDLCDVRDAALAVKAERDRWRDKATALAGSVRCAGDLADQYHAERDRLAAELAEAKAENEALRQVAQSDRETAKDYADEIAAAHAERDRLAAQVAAVRARADEVESRMMATAKPSEIRAALDGTEQGSAS